MAVQERLAGTAVALDQLADGVLSPADHLQELVALVVEAVDAPGARLPAAEAGVEDVAGDLAAGVRLERPLLPNANGQGGPLLDAAGRGEDRL